MIATTPTTTAGCHLLQQGAEALARIEHAGICIDVPRLEQTIAQVQARVLVIEEELRQDDVWQVWQKRFKASAKLSSDRQLAAVVYGDLGHKCRVWTTKGKESASELALRDVDLPFVKKLFEARHLARTVATFLMGIRREVVGDFIHPVFNLHTASSFRSSCSDPNWQNLPRRNELLAKLVRRCVVPRPGRHFAETDFKGGEVCCNAAICKDPVLLEYVRTDPGAMHRDAAAELFMVKPEQVTKKVRDRAKNQFVFASFYGSYHKQTARGLWEDISRSREFTAWEGGPWLCDWLKGKGIDRLGACEHGCETEPGTFEHHVKDVEERMWRKFKVYAEWRKAQWADYQRKGYFDLPTGFRCFWGKGGAMSRNDTLSYPAQGCLFHCLLWTLIRLQKWLDESRMATRIVGQIHDSIEFDSPLGEIGEVLDKLCTIVEAELPRHWPWLIVPMAVEAEVGEEDASWYDKKPWSREGGKWGPKA